MNSENSFYNLKDLSFLSSSLSMQIAKDIGQKIISNNYKEGDLIENEDTLMTRYQVSRTAVRDAFKILSGKGLIKTRRGIGTHVLPKNNWALLDDNVLAWHHSITPTKELMSQFLDIRKALEPKAAYWAAERAIEEDRIKIQEAYTTMANELSPELYITSDALFHRSILRATRNDFLISFEGVVFSALLMSIPLTNTNTEINQESLSFHRDVSEAIAARDKKSAEHCMNILLEDAEKKINSYFDS